MEKTYREEVERFVREILRIEEEVIFSCRKNGHAYCGPNDWPNEARGWLKKGHENLRGLAKSIGLSVGQHRDYMDSIRSKLQSNSKISRKL